MSAAETLLSVDGLEVAYPSGGGIFSRKTPFVAARDVSFSIGAGETFGLVGESGSGKTTVGRAILRLAPITSGTVHFDGADVGAYGKATPLSYRRAVQMVFQDPRSSLNPRHTVAKILGQVVARHHAVEAAERREIVDDLLDSVQLARYQAQRYPSELSGGQRQRVAIAHALATRPRLIVCDEAVSALDVSTQGQILNLLQDLQAQLGLSYLFISHDLAVVRRVSRAIGVMYRGRLVEIGETETIYNAPRHPYTQMLLASVLTPDPAGRSARRNRRSALRAEAGAQTGTVPKHGCPFQPRCPMALAVCGREAPPLRRLLDGRLAACHAVDEAVAG